MAPLLGPHGAACFQAALIADTIRKLEAISKHAACWLFYTGRIGPKKMLQNHPRCHPEPRLVGAKDPWVCLETEMRGSFASLRMTCTKGFSAFCKQRGRGRWKLVRQRGGDLGERLARAFRRLLSRHPRAIVIGTDSPLLPPRKLREALSELRACDAVLGPCPDGGFYLIGLRCLPPGLFRDVRWGSRFALRDMLRNMLRSGLACSVLEPVPDVDRPQDFRALAAQMGKRRDLRRLSPALWGFLKARSRVGVRRPSARSGRQESIRT